VSNAAGLMSYLALFVLSNRSHARLTNLVPLPVSYSSSASEPNADVQSLLFDFIRGLVCLRNAAGMRSWLLFNYCSYLLSVQTWSAAKPHVLLPGRTLISHRSLGSSGVCNCLSDILHSKAWRSCLKANLARHK